MNNCAQFCNFETVSSVLLYKTYSFISDLFYIYYYFRFTCACKIVTAFEEIPVEILIGNI